MADVTLDPQNSDPKELYGQGIRAYVLQDFETAVSALSTASELLAREHGEEHDSLGDIYLYYGKSLLEFSRKESGPLGEAITKNAEESDSEEAEEETVEDEVEPEPKPKDNEEKVDSVLNGSSGDKSEDGKKAEESENAANKEKEEAGPSAETDKPEGEDDKEGELTDLQVAWEVLELAKKIFTTRGEEGTKNLAETMVTLGEISLESGNFSLAIDDIKQGIELQKAVFSNDSRTVAESYYKLGGAFSANAQIDEAIESFSASYEYLKNKLANLEGDKNEENQEEIDELKALTPEIEEKIADMKNLKIEIANKVKAAESNLPINNGHPSSSSSSSKPVSDISHLVKRKRKSEEDDPKSEPVAKKPTP